MVAFIFTIYLLYSKNIFIMVTQKRINEIIKEELSKTDVNSMIQKKLDSEYSSKDFEKKVKEITASAISELFKVLWQRDNFWKSSVGR